MRPRTERTYEERQQWRALHFIRKRLWEKYFLARRNADPDLIAYYADGFNFLIEFEYGKREKNG